jgi:hypothetical protein
MAMAFCAPPLRAQDAAPTQDATPAQFGLKDGDGNLGPAPPSSPTLPGDATPAPQPAAKKNTPKKKPAKGALPPPPPPVQGTAPPRLPALTIYPKAQRIGLPGGPPALDPDLTPPAPVAVLPPIPAKHRPLADDKPFDPVGIMVGDIKLLPSIEEDVGYSSNPSLLAGPTKGSFYESTQGGLNLQSDWARNELRGSFTGGYTDYFRDPSANSPNGNGVVDGRFDVSRDLALDAEGRFNIATQTPGSVTLPTGVALSSNQRPLVETGGATLGGAQKFGNLTLSLHGTLDRTVYQSATLADGSTEDLASDDLDDWGLRTRAAYQISPIVIPFVETVIDTRRYDSPVDFTGYARSSNGVLGRGGVTLALSNQLTGEASLGYGERQYKDPRLPDLHAPLVDASLIWSATPLTTVTLKTSTTLADTTNAGDSGAVSRSYTIDVSHALLRNFTLAASAGYATDVYAGAPLHDSTTSFGLHADYNLNRDVVLRASASRTQYASSAPGSNYVANVFMLGLKLQR